MYSDTQLANRQVDMQKKYILFRNFTDSVWAPCDVHGSKDTLLKLKGMTRHTLGWGGVGVAQWQEHSPLTNATRVQSTPSLGNM